MNSVSRQRRLKGCGLRVFIMPFWLVILTFPLSSPILEAMHGAKAGRHTSC